MRRPGPMPSSIVLPSTLLLTLLLATGLVFFLRASSKDRTTAMVISSYRPSLQVLGHLDSWLAQRGWQVIRSHPEQRHLVYEGHVAASVPLAVLLALLGCCGGAALGLVICQVLPKTHLWPLALGLVGLAGRAHLSAPRPTARAVGDPVAQPRSGGAQSFDDARPSG